MVEQKLPGCQVSLMNLIVNLDRFEKDDWTIESARKLDSHLLHIRNLAEDFKMDFFNKVNGVHGARLTHIADPYYYIDLLMLLKKVITSVKAFVGHFKLQIDAIERVRGNGQTGRISERLEARESVKSYLTDDVDGLQNLIRKLRRREARAGLAFSDSEAEN